MKFNIPVPLKSELEFDYSFGRSDPVARVYLGEVVIHEYRPDYDDYGYGISEAIETEALNQVAEKLKRLLDTLD